MRCSGEGNLHMRLEYDPSYVFSLFGLHSEQIASSETVDVLNLHQLYIREDELLHQLISLQRYSTNKLNRERGRNGVLLLLGGPEEDSRKHQAGGGTVCEVQRRCSGCQHEDVDQILQCPLLFKELESHRLFLLWHHPQVLCLSVGCITMHHRHITSSAMF